jgi:general secretion pathway protein A
MYKNFFGLRENPFNVNPDPRFLYLTPQTQEALGELAYGIRNHKGFILLTGEVGTGKTTLINCVLNWLRRRKMPVAFIFNSRMSVNHLFEFILTDFGISIDFRLKSNMLMRLNAWLTERFRAGERPVLIVDEAQGLSFELLEEIRLLLNLETATEKLLQIVLAGQPELEDRLKRPELWQLRQRITLRCRTAPFTLEESHGYITERLRIGGATGDSIFASDAMDVVHFYSQGIPRIINLLCEHALINAYVEHSRQVQAPMVEEAAHEFFLGEGRQFETRRNSAAVESSNPAVMDSIVVNELERPFATEEPNLPEPSYGASPAELGARVAVEGSALTARNNTVATVWQREGIPPSMENLNAPVLLKDLIPASVGTEVKAKESALCLDSIACVSGCGPPLIKERKRDQTTNLAIPPLLIRSRTEDESSSPAKSSPTAPAENRPLTLHALNQPPRSTRRTTIHAPLLSWKSWSPRWVNAFLATISLAKLSHAFFAALRRIRRSTFLIQALLRRWKCEFRLDWIAMINTMALPEMKKNLLRWLRQPWQQSWFHEVTDYRGIQEALGAPARLCQRSDGSRTPVAKRISGGGGPDPEGADEGSAAAFGRRKGDTCRDRSPHGSKGSGGHGGNGQARNDSGSVSEAHREQI